MKTLNVYYSRDIPPLQDWERERILRALPENQSAHLAGISNINALTSSLMCYLLLCDLLHRKGLCEGFPDLFRDENGKPCLSDAGIHFSYSQCRGGIACAVAENRVGVDIQDIRGYNPSVVNRVCGVSEINELLKTSEAEQPTRFTRMWAEKESISKMTGVGFRLGFSGIDTLAENKTAVSVLLDEKTVLAASYDTDFTMNAVRADIGGILSGMGIDRS